MRTKGRTIVMLVVVGTTIVAACTGGGAASPTTPVASATPSGESPSTAPVASIVASVPASELTLPGKLEICSDLPYPPDEFFDDQGNPTGSDIEIGQQLASRLGLQAAVVNSVFDTIIAAINGGKCDIIMSAMGITTDRTKAIDMIPYAVGGSSAVVPKGDPKGIGSAELDMCGVVIAAQTGTSEADLVLGEGDFKGDGLTKACTDAGKAAPTLKTFVKDSDALLALLSSQVDVYLTGLASGGYYTVQRPSELQLTGWYRKGETLGIGIAKGKPGLESGLNAALQSILADGTYDTILKKYGIEFRSIKG